MLDCRIMGKQPILDVLKRRDRSFFLKWSSGEFGSASFCLADKIYNKLIKSGMSGGAAFRLKQKY
jgi:hypothetical protein